MSAGAATQVASRKFDEKFFALPAGGQRRLQARLDSLGLRLPHYPHFRMQGCDTFRLRVGDYRIIYQFDIQRNELYLITLGHRRDIYKP
jgi:mRNA-degrading endonuclease RelE of RelBE toxin-antitoxin system